MTELCQNDFPPMGPGACTEAHSLFLSAADGDLDSSQLASLEKHLEACTGCRARREALFKIDGKLLAYGAFVLAQNPPPPDQRERLVEFLDAQERQSWLQFLVERLHAFLKGLAARPARYVPLVLAGVAVLIFWISRIGVSFPQPPQFTPQARHVSERSGLQLTVDSNTARTVKRVTRSKKRNVRTQEAATPLEFSPLLLSNAALPLQGVEVVRLELSMVGPEIDPFLQDGVDGTVLIADVMFGQDGLPRAVRVVR